MPKRASTEARLVALEVEVRNTLAGVGQLVGRLTRSLSASDCGGALLGHRQGAAAFASVARKLAKMSALHDALRREQRPRPVRPSRKGRPVPAVAVQREASLSDAPRRAPRPATCPTDREECGYSVEGGVCTIRAPLIVPAGGGAIGTEKVAARYCLVEIGQLQTSHLPLRGFEPNPAFPTEAQERDYRLTAERAKVQEIAESYEPALIFNTSPGAVDGVPVATEDRIVLGGNGRTMATSLVYCGRSTVEPGVPREYLVEHAHEFGIDPDAIAAFAHPMIVRTVRVAHDVRTLAAWSRRLNTSLSQQLDATRLAVSRARFVDEASLRELDAMGDDETLAAFLATSRSLGFVRALQRGGVIDGRAAQAFLTADGYLNEQGRDLAADLLVAVLIPDADVIAAYGRGPIAALARAAPALVQAAAWPDYDLRAALRKAVRDRVTMRAAGFDRVDDFLRQGGLLAESSAAVTEDPQATIMLRVLVALEGAPAKLTRFARRYVELARPAGTGQGALFTSEQLAPLDALRRAATEAGVKLP